MLSGPRVVKLQGARRHTGCPRNFTGRGPWADNTSAKSRQWQTILSLLSSPHPHPPTRLPSSPITTMSIGYRIFTGGIEEIKNWGFAVTRRRDDWSLLTEETVSGQNRRRRFDRSPINGTAQRHRRDCLFPVWPLTGNGDGTSCTDGWCARTRMYVCTWRLRHLPVGRIMPLLTVRKWVRRSSL